MTRLPKKLRSTTLVSIDWRSSEMSRSIDFLKKMTAMSDKLQRLARITVCCVAASLLGSSASNVGASQTSSEVNPPQVTELIAQTLDDSGKNIARLRAEAAAREQAGNPLTNAVRLELELWQRLQLLTLQRKATLEDIEKYREQLNGIEIGDEAIERPQSFLAVDALRDRLESDRKQLQSLRLEWEAEKRIVLTVKDKFEEAEQLRRRAEERYELSQAEERGARGREQLLARLQSRVVEAELAFHRDQSELMSTKIRALDASVSSLEGLVQAHSNKFTLTREELEQRLTLIDQMETQVRQHLAEADARLHASMRDLAAGGAEASSTTYEVAREESQLFQRLLSGAGEFKECWRKRYALSNGQASAGDIERWMEESDETLARVSQIVEQLKHRTEQKREALSQINRSILASKDEATRGQLANEAAELHRIIDVYGEIQTLATGGHRLCQRLIEDLEARVNRFSLSEYVQLAYSSLRAGWEYELTTIDDEPITVRKIVFGCVLLLCGYYFSRMLATAFAYRVSPRFGVTPAGSAVLRSVLFYLLMTAFGFVSLEIVNVPLTVFAFLGGAVAIGVGFGSQNLINNFISGLILLVERPIRIGDLVNVDGIDANVEHIGARSTRVRTGANLEILVPNSKFLENNVTNWTLSDTRTRTSVSVGVAYGSPVREVTEILSRVIRRNDKALDSPEPIVLFQEFADSSLVFEVHFWIHMKRMMDGAKIRSEVRVDIDDAFREAGIVIAFPQRDVHIDMSSPIEVSLREPASLERPLRRAA